MIDEPAAFETLADQAAQDGHWDQALTWAERLRELRPQTIADTELSTLLKQLSDEEHFLLEQRSSFAQAEGVLGRGEADAVAAARQSLADPDWFLKMRLGRGDEIRRCVYTNYCEGLDQKHKQVTCQLWDRKALDSPGIRLTPDAKRRLTAPPWQR